MKISALTLNKIENNIDLLLEKDLWLASDIGLQADATHGAYYLSFSNITIDWLNKAAKKFVRLQATTRSYSTCRGYIRGFNHLNDYIQTLNTFITPNNINRAFIVGFIQYLAQRDLNPSTRGITLMNIRTFHQVALQEEWLNFQDKPFIFNNDLPRDTTITPKFISQDVLIQLRRHLHCLSEWMQRFILVLLETGRRVSEVSFLKFDCLEQDSDGDWLLRVHEKKLKRERLIPISPACVEAIKAQQIDLKDSGHISPLLFPSRRQSKSPTISAPHINRALNKLAQEKNIVDANGIIWKFSSHQFRHTVGTQMINAGVPQVMVQKYLGHESPEMTARYAHIHDNTMKAAFVDYQDRLIDIQGQMNSSNDHLDARWLKQNILTQALPNGLCALPLTQQKCPHANACLTCTHFRTSKKHLEQHRSQLEETNKIIAQAKQNGWKRAEEINQDVAISLTTIINTLENNP
ncbi:TPA: tyrosine-type recombinase/integrase [Legionella pneumophila]|nr:tyrosine-type recombinase/integrase [Legionella pneumophila]HAT3884934.1 tyrosine-type recombinase/integrase [Legionella pneumophila]HAT8335938.1 tyrosine-type recombinase/integrase [Legionella pneumophila]HAT8336244.1 tyrosine-type recombinase/integrase [Legionella pneumophila]HAU0970182.1 tyrosine-type recombinase/integrase [Legionella pneumophila]